MVTSTKFDLDKKTLCKLKVQQELVM
jgi:hypothetical protein